MNVNKIAVYTLVVLTGMMVASLAAYYLLMTFGYTKQAATDTALPDVSSVLVDGTVTSIHVEDAVDGMATFMIATKANETKTIKVPKVFGVCASASNMVEWGQIAIGDELAVRGAAAEDGVITPCGDATHYLKAIKATPLMPAENTGTSTATTTVDGARVAAPKATTSAPAKLKVINFTGKLESVDTGCFADGECFVIVDGKHITAIRGWSQDVVGSVQGVAGFGDLEQKIGKNVEVYAHDMGDGTYSLYGSAGFYIKVLP